MQSMMNRIDVLRRLNELRQDGYEAEERIEIVNEEREEADMCDEDAQD